MWFCDHRRITLLLDMLCESESNKYCFCPGLNDLNHLFPGSSINRSHRPYHDRWRIPALHISIPLINFCLSRPLELEGTVCSDRETTNHQFDDPRVFSFWRALIDSELLLNLVLSMVLPKFRLSFWWLNRLFCNDSCDWTFNNLI